MVDRHRYLSTRNSSVSKQVSKSIYKAQLSKSHDAPMR